ncbi:MAG: nucleotide exchange factor GrpE [Burkholderiaceae bacterium]|nr:nucleotide exchange factor GrpE [Burkholderiaceae bacterium]
MTAPKEPADSRPDTPAQQADSDAGVDAQADAFAPSETVDTDDSDVHTRLDAALAEVNELREAALRARAEAENIRRRAQEDVAKAHKFGIESFAEALVPVKDSLEQALAQPEQTLDTLREGVEITLRQLSSAFERGRLKEIAPAQGDKFDPHLHQAISSLPSDQPANTVIATLQKGYLIADRTLRPALVTVAAG